MVAIGSGSTALTGTDGIAVFGESSLVARLTNWSINHSVGETAWGDSDSYGYTSRKRAREDATGSMTGKFDTTTKIYALGAAATGLAGLLTKLVLWQDRTAGQYWMFENALIQNYQMTVDMDSKEVVEWSMDFGADGKFYRPGQTSAPAATVPA